MKEDDAPPTPRPLSPEVRALFAEIGEDVKRDVRATVGLLKTEHATARRLLYGLACFVVLACVAQCGFQVFLQKGVRDSIEDLDRRLRRVEERVSP